MDQQLAKTWFARITLLSFTGSPSGAQTRLELQVARPLRRGLSNLGLLSRATEATEYSILGCWRARCLIRDCDGGQWRRVRRRVENMGCTESVA